jgi:hypothetical protein
VRSWATILLQCAMAIVPPREGFNHAGHPVPALGFLFERLQPRPSGGGIQVNMVFT